MNNPYKPPTDDGHQPPGQQKQLHLGILSFKAIMAALAGLPAMLGLLWLIRFLVIHKLAGISIERSHHWLLLTILGLVLTIVFAPLSFYYIKSIVNDFKLRKQ